MTLKIKNFKEQNKILENLKLITSYEKRISDLKILIEIQSLIGLRLIKLEKKIKNLSYKNLITIH